MTEFDRETRRERDPDREQAERDAFLVLYHLYNLSGGEPGAAFPIERVCRDLAFYEERSWTRLSNHLEWGRFLRIGEAAVSITAEGLEYIRRAGRRRSARLEDWSSSGSSEERVAPW